ncbi:DUF6183 family protein [Brevibacillus sp. SYSU BS000544]|uniref:DUF6183 family protein n=1 Tax=Brevibacillus sp. SYSU BS000544 TaxID=3416443 RepID=UPI003CE4706A
MQHEVLSLLEQSDYQWKYDYDTILKTITRWAEEGYSERLYEVIMQLEKTTQAILAEDLADLPEDIQNRKMTFYFQVQSLLNRTEARLAYLSGIDSLYYLLVLPKKRETRNGRKLGDLRFFMALFVSGHTKEQLLEALNRYRSIEEYQEALSIMVYEMISRGMDIASEPIVLEFHAALKRNNHELAWLPIALTEIEKTLDNREYNKEGLGNCSLPYGPFHKSNRRYYEKRLRKIKQLRLRSLPFSKYPQFLYDIYKIFLPYFFTYILSEKCAKIRHQVSSNVIKSITQLQTDEDCQRVQTATRHWNRNECKIIKLDAAIQANQLSKHVLTRLSLDSLQGASLTDIYFERISPVRAFQFLYASAANGDAYSNGSGGAYGRLEAWRTLAALVGASEKADYLEVLSLLKGSSWYYFDAASNWFHGVAWDLGIGVLRNDGTTIAILAATDTD